MPRKTKKYKNLLSKIYLIENIEADHFDGSINDKSEKYELFKKWHWEWSKYYFLYCDYFDDCYRFCSKTNNVWKKN